MSKLKSLKRHGVDFWSPVTGHDLHKAIKARRWADVFDEALGRLVWEVGPIMPSASDLGHACGRMGIIFYKLVITLCTNMHQPSSPPKGCQVSWRIWQSGAISQCAWRKTCVKIASLCTRGSSPNYSHIKRRFSLKDRVLKASETFMLESFLLWDLCSFTRVLAGDGRWRTFTRRHNKHIMNARLSGCHLVEILAVVKIVFFKLSESDQNWALDSSPKMCFLNNKVRTSSFGSNLPISNILLRWTLGGFFRKEPSRPCRWYCRVQRNVRMCLGRAVEVVSDVWLVDQMQWLYTIAWIVCIDIRIYIYIYILSILSYTHDTWLKTLEFTLGLRESY